MDKSFLAFETKFRVSDIIFKQHMSGQFNLNTVIITMQLLFLIISVILGLFGIRIANIVCVVNLVLCSVVLFNNYINERAWKKAKDRQKQEVDTIIDVLINDNATELDVARALNINIPYNRPEFDKLSEPDEDENITNLKLRWKQNAMLNKETGVKDANGIEYKTGDIVFNPSIRDLWFVEAIDKKRMKEFGVDVPYILTLYGNEDEYYMGLNEPIGFEIDLRVTDFAYVNCLLSFIEVYKQHRQEEEELRKSVSEEANNEQSKVDQIDQSRINE